MHKFWFTGKERIFQNFFGDGLSTSLFVVHDETMDLQNTFPDSIVVANRQMYSLYHTFDSPESERRFVYAMLRKKYWIIPGLS